MVVLVIIHMLPARWCSCDECVTYHGTKTAPYSTTTTNKKAEQMMWTADDVESLHVWDLLKLWIAITKDAGSKYVKTHGILSDQPTNKTDSDSSAVSTKPSPPSS
jgi:hypothetical protein